MREVTLSILILCSTTILIFAQHHTKSIDNLDCTSLSYSFEDIVNRCKNSLIFDSKYFENINSPYYRALTLNQNGNALTARIVPGLAVEASKTAWLSAEQVDKVKELLANPYFNASPYFPIPKNEAFTAFIFFKDKRPVQFNLTGSLPTQIQEIIDFVNAEIDKQQRKFDEKSLKLQNNQTTSSNKLVVQFTGNKIFSSKTLLTNLNPCLAKYPDSTKENNYRFLHYCLQDVRQLIWEQGYLRSKVGIPQIQSTKNGFKATVPIEEGIIYRIGNISTEGAKIFSTKQLLYCLNLKQGDIADGNLIREATQEKLKEIYDSQGYILFDSDLQMEFKPPANSKTEGIVNLKVIIDEGQRFVVNKIEFIGNEHTSDQILRRALVLLENKPYTSELLRLSIENLNRLNLFERIDADRDVQLKTDNEVPRIDVRIRLTEKKK